MSISYRRITVENTSRQLKNLSEILSKAAVYCAERKINEQVLAESRLFPDMYTLAKQVQVACDMSKFAVARLTGSQAPSFEDTETTLTELQQRISKTVKYIESMPEAAFVGCENRTITLPWRPEQPMNPEVYLIDFVIPNVLFHVTTAYNILRHNGVVIGKADFVGAI